MRAVYLDNFDRDDPAAAVKVGDVPEPDVPPGWTVVNIEAAAINHHDVWSARGLALREEQLPMILGCDAAGTDEDGRPVIVHGVVTDPEWLGPENLDPSLSLFSERHPGTLAERVAVPRVNLVPKPEELSFAEAACLPTAWLTAYRMLFVQGGLRPGDTVLVQGSSGGLSSACIMLGTAAGVRVWVTGRSAAKRDYARSLGAHGTFEVGERLPARVDAVMDSVGEATWEHSLKALRKGGAMVVSGGTGGMAPRADLARLFYGNLRIVGSTMGTREELERLIQLMVLRGLRPMIDAVLPLESAAEGFRKLVDGEVRGKVVLDPHGRAEG